MAVNNGVRVRFAPSPTGNLHIGGLRTALFNFLFARHHNGVFLIRIEDTDIERSQSVFVDAIFDALKWMQIESDEPVYFQTDRLDIYRKMIDQLLSQGKAYRCYCTPQELAQKQERMGLDYRYDERCRNLQEPIAGRQSTVRYKLPKERSKITFIDMIRGEISIELGQLDDFIIARSDGLPVYNFAVVVDDAYSKITHIIRGEEHISNTPKQILLYEALRYQVPLFAHLPLILGPSGKKLSKREAAVSVMDYKDQGFLPYALFNYLARLGWSHGDQEIFTQKELIDFFNISHVHKKGAMFDAEKLSWLNSHYIKESDNDHLLEYMRCNNIFDPHILTPHFSHEQLHALLKLYKERAKTLLDIVQGILTVYHVPVSYERDGIEKYVSHDTSRILVSVLEQFEKIELWNLDNLKDSLKKVCNQFGVKLGDVAHPLRLAITGISTSPGIFDLLVIIGKVESMEQINKFLVYIQN
ncbi:MAG TPA: glutamate--tRNA ligase [Candidatus Babeliales bacterium]|nr:glutamate--tRNA ligase [Candidatus Babeliales bacterium]